MDRVAFTRSVTLACRFFVIWSACAWVRRPALTASASSCFSCATRAATSVSTETFFSLAIGRQALAGLQLGTQVALGHPERLRRGREVGARAAAEPVTEAAGAAGAGPSGGADAGLVQGAGDLVGLVLRDRLVGHETGQHLLDPVERRGRRAVGRGLRREGRATDRGTRQRDRADGRRRDELLPHRGLLRARPGRPGSCPRALPTQNCPASTCAEPVVELTIPRRHPVGPATRGRWPAAGRPRRRPPAPARPRARAGPRPHAAGDR